MFAIIPIIDNVITFIDGHIQATTFNAEQALTRNTASVNMDAIISCHMHDAEKTALAITTYRETIIDQDAQTSLRDGRAFDLPPQTVQRYLAEKTVSLRLTWRFNHKIRSRRLGRILCASRRWRLPPATGAQTIGAQSRTLRSTMQA